nr:hypothetical protein [Tanacetum cinerariifolium]
MSKPPPAQYLVHQSLAVSRRPVAASYWTAASDVAATSSPANDGHRRSTTVNAAGQRRSTPLATSQRRRVTVPPVTWQLRQRRSTAAVHGGDRRSTTVNATGHRSMTADHGGDWRSTTVAGGEPPLTAAGPPLTTTGPPVNSGWWAGQRPMDRKELEGVLYIVRKLIESSLI